MVTVTACKRQRLDQWHYSPFDCFNNEYWRCSICLNRKVFGYVIILAMTNGVFVLWRCSTSHGVLKKTLKPNTTSIWKEPMVTVITKVHSIVSTMSADWRCSSCLTRNVVGSVIILAMTNGVLSCGDSLLHSLPMCVSSHMCFSPHMCLLPPMALS